MHWARLLSVIVSHPREITWPGKTVLRQVGHLQDALVAQAASLVQPRDARGARPGARVDEDALGLQHLFANMIEPEAPDRSSV